jgi:predicted DNA-binding protein
MERLNLNVPPPMRARIRALAKRRGRTEGEVARELVAEALEHAEREEIAQAVAAAETDDIRARKLAIAREMDDLRRLDRPMARRRARR